MANETFTLKHCRLKEDKINRTHLVSFSNGSLQSENSDKVAFEAYENAITAYGHQRLKIRKILVATTDRLQYSGLNLDQIFHDGEKTQTFVGCLKRRKGKMTIYPADIFLCKPILEIAQENKEEEKEENITSYSEKVDALTEAFGSKTKKRSMNVRMKYKVPDDEKNISLTESLEQSYIQLKAREAEKDDSLIKDDSIDVFPPQNADAESADEVYNINDLISEFEYTEIEPQANILLHCSNDDLVLWEKDSVYAKFVLNYLKNNIGEISLHKAKLLAYYNYIVQFSKLRYSELRRKDIAPGIPDPFKEIMIKKFLVITIAPNGNEHKSMPPKMKDKIIAHAFVLALFIDDFSVELTTFLSDYNVPPLKLQKIVQALGCTILQRKIDNIITKVVVLKLPLFVPKEKFYARGKRKNKT